MSDPFLGEIRLFPYNFVPLGWLACAGQLMPISSNAALFALLGTAYGGDGVKTFGLPDLRSRVAVGVGQGLGLTNYPLGTTMGVEAASLTAAEMPAHTHTINVSTASATTNNPQNNYLAEPNSGGDRPTAANGYASPNTSNATLAAGSVNNCGGNLPHSNMQPGLALQYCIATQGIYPAPE